MESQTFTGRHYETGTLCNALAAQGIVDSRTSRPFSEATILGASGGIAFGYFVFEYEGYLPHVALLTRNTFDPFNRALDVLGIRREVRETTDPAKGEKNLIAALEMGSPAIVWADIFSMPFMDMPRDDMWLMCPLLVTGFDGQEFQVVAGTEKPFSMTRDEMSFVRGKVKKDRFRIMTIESAEPDLDRLKKAAQSTVGLFLDKPPAGSPNNFGATGMRHMAKMLLDAKDAKGWPRKFATGPKQVQGLAGTFGQPGLWDWVQAWGTQDGADRGTFAEFLRRLGEPFDAIAAQFDRSALAWRRFAEAALSSSMPECATLKSLKEEHWCLWRREGRASQSKRQEIRAHMLELEAELAVSQAFANAAPEIFGSLAQILDEIVEIEEPAFQMLRGAEK